MHWNTKITRKCDELEHYYVFETWKVLKTLTIDLQRSPIQSETMMRELHRGQIGGKVRRWMLWTNPGYEMDDMTHTEAFAGQKYGRYDPY